MEAAHVLYHRLETQQHARQPVVCIRLRGRPQARDTHTPGPEVDLSEPWNPDVDFRQFEPSFRGAHGLFGRVKLWIPQCRGQSFDPSLGMLDQSNQVLALPLEHVILVKAWI